MSELEVQDLRAGYGRMEVIHGISFGVATGQVVVILGANGAGKTTTLRCLSGLLPFRGSVVFDGKRISPRTRSYQLARRGIAHVLQGRGTINDLTVEENLLIGGYRVGRRAAQRAVGRWYEIFPQLRDRQHAQAASLSGGEQQMLAIARALMSEPKLVLLDEPSMGLAPIITQSLFDRLATIVAEFRTSLLLVEQNAQLALDVAEHAYVLEAGAMVASGPAGDLRDDPAVRRAYVGA